MQGMETAPQVGGASGPIAAGVLSAIGASACCAGPLVLVALGLGGAWVSGLRALEPFYPVFIAIAIGAFGFAFWRLYITPRRCAPEVACASPKVLRRQRIAFWVTLVFAKAMILFPLYGPRLLA
jgi:mercuric ion transport protein